MASGTATDHDSTLILDSLHNLRAENTRLKNQLKSSDSETSEKETKLNLLLMEKRERDADLLRLRETAAKGFTKEELQEVLGEK